MTQHPRRSAYIVLIALFLTACAPSEPQPAADEAGAPALPAVAVLEAQYWLADLLGVPAAEVVIVSSEQREWSDSCLGLGGPAESCLAAKTPGWLLSFEAGGQRYEVRSDETGEALRSPQFPAEPPGPPKPLEPPVPPAES